MKIAVKKWLHGLAAAFIGGAAAGGVAMIQDPATFNFTADGWLKLASVCFVAGVVTAFAYLTQSPLPPKR
jgi:hypothetical protein